MKPRIIGQILARDATEAFDIAFEYDGNLPYKNKATIINSTTLVQIYNATITSTEYKHTVPADILTNGVVYTVQITVYDKNNVASEISSKSTLYCYSDPIFEFNYLNNEGITILTTPTLNPSLYYSQTEGEVLSSFKIVFYDHNHVELSTSGILYNLSSITPINGLNDEEKYYIQATGETLHGIELDTGLLEIHTKFTTTSIPTALIVENIPSEGSIKFTSNIRIVEVSTGTSVIFINGVEIDLRKNYVDYNDGIPKIDNMDFQIRGRDFTLSDDIVVFTDDDDNQMYIEYLPYKDYESGVIGGLDCALFKFTTDPDYASYTQHFPLPIATDEIRVQLIKSNNLYEIHALVKGVVY